MSSPSCYGAMHDNDSLWCRTVFLKVIIVDTYIFHLHFGYKKPTIVLLVDYHCHLCQVKKNIVMGRSREVCNNHTVNVM